MPSPNSASSSVPRRGNRAVPAALPFQPDLDLLSVLVAVQRTLGLAVAGSVMVAVLYLVKSALGIDLLPGPSPLHDLLYPLLRR